MHAGHQGDVAAHIIIIGMPQLVMRFIMSQHMAVTSMGRATARTEKRMRERACAKLHGRMRSAPMAALGEPRHAAGGQDKRASETRMPSTGGLS